MAQVYLEVVRLWTVNVNNIWLYNRVESAGLQISSQLSSQAVAAKVLDHKLFPGGKPISAKTVNEVAHLYGGPDKQCEELRSTFDRIRDRKLQGIEIKHFADFSHIICFDSGTREALISLRNFAKTQLPANAPALKGWVTMLKMVKPPEGVQQVDTKGAYELIKERVRLFLQDQFHWTQPAQDLTKGQFRTRQFPIAKGRREAVVRNTEAIKKMTGCKRLRVHADPAGYLVTIVGPEDKLKWAEALVNAA